MKKNRNLTIKQRRRAQDQLHSKNIWKARKRKTEGRYIWKGDEDEQP